MEESKSSASAPEEEPSLFTAAEPSPPEAPPAAPHHAAPAPAPAAAAPADTRRQELLEALAAKQISKVCRIVERLKFDVDAPLNDDGETAVHVCVHHCGTRRDPGFVPVLRCLLRLGANPDAARAGGQMPAHRCAAFDLTPMLALLGEFGAEVDREDDEGYAPAHVCAAWGKTSALEWLPPLTGPTPDTCTDRQLPSVVRAVGAQLRAWADNETAAKPAAAKPRARAKSAGPRRGGGDFKVGMREQVPAQRRPYDQFQRPHSATVIR